MGAAAIGLISAGATVLAAVIGGWILLLVSRNSQKQARDAEQRRLDAESRAAEAERLNAELSRWTNFTEALQGSIEQLRQELSEAKASEEEQRTRAQRLQELLDSKSRDLQLALREVERLRARLGDE